MAPRPRRRRALPHGIAPESLPPYVYWDASGHGRWLLHRYDPQRQRTRATRLCGPECTLREIWEAYQTAEQPARPGTLAEILDAFETSPTWSDLAESTRRDYRICSERIRTTPTRAGLPLASTRIADWTPGTVRAYVDRRAESSRSRANHELRYLRRVFAWAHERDLLDGNPARGVRSLTEPPRQRYVGEGEYTAFLAMAAPRYPYLLPVAELAYLCRLRLAEICDIRRDDIGPEGLYAARRKGSRAALTEWTPRLRLAVDTALSQHGQIASLYLIASPSRGRMRESTIQTAWQRCMRDWAAAGNPRFTLHDLKRAGVSDAKGDKLAASGHRSHAMLRVYDVLPARAPATR